MKNSEIIKKLISYIDLKKSSNDSLISQNCFCPGVAKLHDPSKLERCTFDYYIILSNLVSSIINNELEFVCDNLNNLKLYLSDYQITLSDFCYSKGVFFGTGIFYVETEHNPLECFGIRTMGPPPVEIRKKHNIKYVDGFFITDEIPGFLKELDFKCLTKDNSIHYILYDLVYPYSDPNTQKLLMSGKWDEIDFQALEIYIHHELRNKKTELKSSDAQEPSKIVDGWERLTLYRMYEYKNIEYRIDNAGKIKTVHCDTIGLTKGEVSLLYTILNGKTIRSTRQYSPESIHTLLSGLRKKMRSYFGPNEDPLGREGKSPKFKIRAHASVDTVPLQYDD